MGRLIGTFMVASDKVRGWGNYDVTDINDVADADEQ